MRDFSKTKVKWSLSDVVSFECQRMLDQGVDGDGLEKRDRSILAESKNKTTSRRELLKCWLSAMKQIRPLQPDPALTFQSTFVIFASCLFLTFLIAGISTAAVCLKYDGSVPVNVAVFLGVIVAPQVLLLFVYFPMGLIILFKKSWVRLLYAVPVRVLQGFWSFIWNQLTRRSVIHGKTEDAVKLGFGNFASILRLHGALFANRIFTLIQLAGIAFNIGVLACSMLLLTFTDRAFGWQSSLVDSASSVAVMVERISTPWKYLVGETIAHPSLEQIRGSHIVLKDSSINLKSSDLLAWWPFLFLSVVFYGALPRFFMLVLAIWNEQRLLKSLSFDTYECRRIVERMKSPDLTTLGLKTPAREDVESEISELERVDRADPAKTVECVVMLQGSLQRYSEAGVLDHLRVTSGLKFKRLVRISVMAQELDVSLVAEGHLWMLIEGWQPPIQEFLRELEYLANTFEKDGFSLKLILLGKPAGDCIRDLPESLYQVWCKKTQLLGCSNLSIVHLENMSSSEK